MRKQFRSRMLVLMALLGSAAGVAAECAPRISGDLSTGPITGTLWGTTRVTAGFGGGGLGFTGNYSISFEIGTYRMSDGSMLNIDCRTYRISVLPV